MGYMNDRIIGAIEDRAVEIADRVSIAFEDATKVITYPTRRAELKALLQTARSESGVKGAEAFQALMDKTSPLIQQFMGLSTGEKHRLGAKLHAESAVSEFHNSFRGTQFDAANALHRAQFHMVRAEMYMTRDHFAQFKANIGPRITAREQQVAKELDFAGQKALLV